MERKIVPFETYREVVQLDDFPQLSDLIEAYDILNQASFEASQDPFDEQGFIWIVNARTYLEACIVSELRNATADMLRSKWYMSFKNSKGGK